MRLSTEQRLAVKAHFSHEVGADCEVLLFGSRTDDEHRGGDVDLLVRSPRPLQRPVWLAARLAAYAERLLGGRRVDVLLLDPATKLQPIHAAALATGVVL
ncbi:MAG: nucleotidyltransferase domain-containing protein [Burkholderiales bacterium]|nr:nucleotidyltransferase domain-containing protein [Burkholderiales bacterium]